MISPQKWIGVAAIVLAVAVALGAFGAHALEAKLDAHRMEIWGKANFYHFIHGLAILIIAALGTATIDSGTAVKICSILFFGVCIFSGSLYTLALTDIKILGAITPIGGAAFIIGWLMLGFDLLRK